MTKSSLFLIHVINTAYYEMYITEKFTLLFALLFIAFFSMAQLSGPEIIEKSIEYHDPNGVWPSLIDTLKFQESRPDENVRITLFAVDNGTGSFLVNRNDEEIHGVNQDSCFIIKGDADCDRAIMLRNYYLYLWGLPMKLKDPGTSIDSATTLVNLDDKEVLQVRVPYEKDTWYFFFYKESYRLVGYKFYQDEDETEGEVIHLEEQVTLNSIKYPKKRSWYRIPGLVYLGTDELMN